MGSIVAYKCPSCSYATEQLSVGWGKAVCAECKDLIVIDLAEQRADRRDRRCAKCNAPVKLIEGTIDRIPCPRCGAALRHATLGSWS